MAKNQKRTQAKSPSAGAPRPLALWVATALALATAAFALFLWEQLLVARSGGEPFCALGAQGCATLWDGVFARAVQDWTGLPVAAWGVLWGVVSAGFAAFCAWRAQEGRAAEPAWSALKLLAASGAVVVVLLVAAGLQADAFCSNCLIIQLAVAAFAGTVWLGAAGPAAQEWPNGVALAGGIAALAFALLWVPGRNTPPAGGHLGAGLVPASAAAPPSADDALSLMISRLSEGDLQALATALGLYRNGHPLPPRAPRALLGDPQAPVQLTTFTDSGCSHCAIFHEALEQLLKAVPKDSIAIEQRVFPLDASCNPLVQRGGNDELCLAAQVRVCLEQDPGAIHLAGWLHEAVPLSAKKVYQAAERLAPRQALDECIAAPETAAKIEDDIALGQQAGISGTPFLLLNGTPAPTYLPFLYAMVLAEGNAGHPAFAVLPEPDLSDPHAGHGH